jgi:succinoglycan biosynthesis transport protein ExoP
LASPERRPDWLEPPQEELGLKRYVETVRERIGLVAIAVVVTTLIAIVYVLITTKTYDAEADLLVTPVATDTLPSLPLIRESADPTRDVQTAARFVTNTDVARRVIADLHLSISPQNLLKQVKAEPVAESDIVAVTASDHTPEEARNLANSFARQAVAERTDQLHGDIDSQIAGLQTQLAAGAQPALSARLSDLQALRSGPDPTLSVETAADTPTSPSKPRPALTVSGGILAGLVLGLAAAFASQILDPRLRREEQLRRSYRLPILARVPAEPGRDNRPLGPRRVSPAGLEAYRALRTALDNPLSRAQGSRTILVTSSAPSEGKTSTAVNLATSLAVAGRKVILIEADLRRPALADALGMEHGISGVVSVLIESDSLQGVLTPSPTHPQNLKLLLADYSGGGIAELFAIPAAERMIQDARKLADFVIIDSPPQTKVVDALPLARMCDDILVVTRLGQTRLDTLSQLAELLDENGIQPVGFVVVGTPKPRGTHGRYYLSRTDELEPLAAQVPKGGSRRPRRAAAARRKAPVRGGNDSGGSEGARLLASRMAANGNTREQIATSLREEFGIRDSKEILDEVGA